MFPRTFTTEKELGAVPCGQRGTGFNSPVTEARKPISIGEGVSCANCETRFPPASMVGVFPGNDQVFDPEMAISVPVASETKSSPGYKQFAAFSRKQTRKQRIIVHSVTFTA